VKDNPRACSLKSYSGAIVLDSVFLSIIIPAFNEEKRIIPTLEAILLYLREQPYSWEVLVVDDGSHDQTFSVVNHWAKNKEGVRAEIISHQGKGWAVRHGMLQAIGAYRFMCDADLSMPIEHLSVFLEQITSDYDVVIGSREIDGAQRFDEPLSRHLNGRLFNYLVRVLLGAPFFDTQCGFKCFRGDVAEKLFKKQKIRGFGFDVEILYMALRLNLKILELPIDWHHNSDSKVRLWADGLAMLIDMIRIKIQNRIP